MSELAEATAAGAHTSSSIDDAVEELVYTRILDKLKCPICLELPGAEVYQCKNGHVICHRCQVKLKLCPQCRTPFVIEGSLIRVRVVESLLESMMEFCPYKQAGCKDLVLKKDIKNHSINCVYNGKSMQLCKHLGYSACSFWTNGLNIESAIEHFMSAHEAIALENNSLDIHLEDFAPNTGCMVSDGVWTPIILFVGGAYFLVLIFFNASDQSVSWVCVKMNYCDSAQYEIGFQIPHVQEGKPPMKWKITPVALMDADEIVKVPWQRTPVKLLYEKYCDFENSLRIKVAVSPAPKTLESDDEEPTRQQEALKLGDINHRTMQVGKQHRQYICQ